MLGARGWFLNLTITQLYEYVDLTFSMSLTRLSANSDYSCIRIFLRQGDFSAVMSQDDYKCIRSGMRFYPIYSHEDAVWDSLWDSRIWFDHFRRKAAADGVPTDVLIFDDNNIRCKAHTAARGCIKRKPIKFAIRMFANVGRNPGYFHTVSDNYSSNSTGIAPAILYCTAFKPLRIVLKSQLENNLIVEDSASILWVLQIAYSTHMEPRQDRRLVATEKFYTRHFFGEQIKRFTGGEVSILSIVRLANLDMANRRNVKLVIEKLHDKPRRSRNLCLAFHRERVAQGGAQRELSAMRVAERYKLIVWKDINIVFVYYNDLADAPRHSVSEPNKHSITCVRGLTQIRRSLGDEATHFTVLQVSFNVTACNFFMNSVDRFDQLRGSHTIMR